MKHYLTEPIELSQSGKLRGKSIRCFEAIYESGVYIPTNRMFSFKNGKLTCTPSFRKLNTFHTYNLKLDHTPPPWRSGIFSSPELALASKLRSFATQYSITSTKLNEALTELQKSDYLLVEYSQFADQYPEICL